jgi:DNA-binding NtrC family response regulator
LYYRIHVIPIHLPPLRHRRDDIPLLIEHFLKDFAQRQGKKPPPLPGSAMERFMRYEYPGNVRELKHVVERYCLLGDAEMLFDESAEAQGSGEVQPVYDDLLSRPNPLKAASKLGKARSERALLSHVLKICGNDYPETARRLNISRSSLYEKLKVYGLHGRRCDRERP